jgi:hypothetical protein
MNNGVSLTIPYYLVPRARSDVKASLREDSETVRLTNRNGVISGNGDFYAWGLQSPPLGLTYFDPRAVGVQTHPFTRADGLVDSLLVFAVNTRTRFSNPARGEFDILVDINGDGKPEFDVVAIDLGLATTGLANGQMAVAVFDLIHGGGSINFLAEAPTDGSTVELPVFASSIGITTTNTSFTYTATASDNFDGVTVSLPGKGSFNAFSPSVSNAMFVPVAPGGSVNVPITVDRVEFAKTPALGVMVVTEDNAAGSSQAHLLGLSRD